MLTRDYVELWRKRKPDLQHSLHFDWELATQIHKYKNTQNTHTQIRKHKHYVELWGKRKPDLQHSLHFERELARLIQQACEGSEDA